MNSFIDWYKSLDAINQGYPLPDWFLERWDIFNLTDDELRERVLTPILVDNERLIRDSQDYVNIYDVRQASETLFQHGIQAEIDVDYQFTFLDEHDLGVTDSWKDILRRAIYKLKYPHFSTHTFYTLDTHTELHRSLQFPLLVKNDNDEYVIPSRLTPITYDDYVNGRVIVNPKAVYALNKPYSYLKKQLKDYLLRIETLIYVDQGVDESDPDNWQFLRMERADFYAWWDQHPTVKILQEPEDTMYVWGHHSHIMSWTHGSVSVLEWTNLWWVYTTGGQLLPRIKGLINETDMYSSLETVVHVDHLGENIGYVDTDIMEAIKVVSAADNELIIFGEADDYCVGSTVRKLAIRYPEYAERIRVIEDATTPIFNTVIPTLKKYYGVKSSKFVDLVQLKTDKGL